jgi:porphyrinogen peroxidase
VVTKGFQSTILAPPAPVGRFVTLGLTRDADPRDIAARLAALPLPEGLVVGIGEPLVRALGQSIPGLRAFPVVAVQGGPGGTFPSTQGALWLYVGGTDPGEILHRARRLVASLGDSLRVDEDVPSFVYDGGRDLSGYEDGTENPKDARAIEAAFAAAGAPGLAGSSFVATQRWIHDLTSFERLPQAERNHIIGRDLVSNEELADAPASAHVKRAAQESYEPAAFMLRRSMPWGDVREHGLYFCAYGASLDPFERVLRRMAGLEDGITDALLRLSHAVTGGYYWCPPVEGDRLDLRALRQ